VGVTESGVQVFDYRGTVNASLPGQVTVLYPDEVHNGRAGTGDGFSYRIVYVEPVRLGAAVGEVRGRPSPLPFVRQAVSNNRRLARTISEAFRAPLDPLAADSLVMELAEGLLEERGADLSPPRRVDARAVERARRLLDAAPGRPVRSAELEAATGLTRYDLARQFRIALGTSPHRYHVLRRLQHARAMIQNGHRLADAAAEAGFADQAHFTRAFTSAFGLSPGRYRTLCRAAGPGGG
jgi:AraC-like DNA-binding protein